MKETQAHGFQVKFDRLDHSINTETYIQALVSLTTVMKEVNYQLGGREKISIDITAQEPGSFKIDLLLKTIQSMFSQDSVVYLASIVTIVIGMVELRKFHKDIDPEKTEINGDDVVIKKNDGTVIYHTNRNTYNIYNNNQAVQDAISDNFRSLERDGDITGYEINSEQSRVRVDRKEFPELAKKIEVKIQDKDTVILPTTLVIVKLVFQGRTRKWDFLHNGSKIAAAVVDKNFWDEVDRGKAFSKGDELVADLKITREYDKDIAAYVNKDYQVVNVREHHPRELRKQISIDDLFD